jgi:hypothetical protein
MISYYGLIELGFSPEEFELQDDSLGEGVFIKKWNSKKKQPSVAEIEQAEQEYLAEAQAQKDAQEEIKKEVLEMLGLTEAELKSIGFWDGLLAMLKKMVKI